MACRLTYSDATCPVPCGDDVCTDRQRVIGAVEHIDGMDCADVEALYMAAKWRLHGDDWPATVRSITGHEPVA